MKTDNKVQEMIDALADADMKNLRGMTYKQGIEDALRWVLGEMSDNSLLTGDEDLD